MVAVRCEFLSSADLFTGLPADILGSSLQSKINCCDRSNDQKWDVVSLGKNGGLVCTDLDVNANHDRLLSTSTDLIGGVTVGNDSISADDNTVNVVMLEQTSQHRITCSIKEAPKTRGSTHRSS